MTVDGRAGITADLVRRLLAGQFPQWADLPIVPVEHDGWDNRTYRLGTELSVRLPTAPGYVAGVAKEDRWLPVLAPHLPLPVPVPVATGRPTADYPHPWSIRRWLPGTPLVSTTLVDPVRFADVLAAFLRALWGVDAHDGIPAGEHSFRRGCPPGFYDDEVETALERLGDRVDQIATRAVWREALASRWTAPPVWFHGDIAVGNLLVDDSGELCAVIDFGTSGVGDPACDLVIAWTLLRGDARSVFRAATALDRDTWARARGWALWKALITMPDGEAGPDSEQAAVIAEVITDHQAHA